MTTHTETLTCAVFSLNIRSNRPFASPSASHIELLDKLRSAKVVDPPLIREIFEALETNGDIPKTWQEAKHTVFQRIFGPKAR